MYIMQWIRQEFATSIVAEILHVNNVILMIRCCCVHLVAIITYSIFIVLIVFGYIKIRTNSKVLNRYDCAYRIYQTNKHLINIWHNIIHTLNMLVSLLDKLNCNYVFCYVKWISDGYNCNIVSQ